MGWEKEQLRESRCLSLCAPVCVPLCRAGAGGGLYKRYEGVCARVSVCACGCERANDAEKGGLCFTPVYVQGNRLA